MLRKTYILTFFVLSTAISSSYAQGKLPDSSTYSSTASHVIDYFNAATANHAEFYNGAMYELYPPANHGTFYFADKNYCVPSLICFNGRWYRNVPVLFDVYHDKMISLSAGNLFVLDSTRLSDVYLLDHHFICINPNNSYNLAAGYYDLLYEGKSGVLVKRSKRIDDNIASSQAAVITYEDKSDIYVKKGSQYYLVNNKGDLMDIFKDKKKALKQYLNANKIDFKSDKESAVVKLAVYYDQTTP